MRGIKLEALAAAFLTAAFVMTVVGVVTVGIVSRSTDVSCVGECLTRNALAMQTHAAVAAWATVIVTLSTGLLVLRTLHHTKRSADAAFEAVKTTERIGKRQIRAYLAIDGAVMKMGTFGSIDFHTELKNTGQSPANAIEAHLQIGLYEISIVGEGDVLETAKWSEEQILPVPHISAAQAYPVRFSFLPLFHKPPIPRIFDTDEHVAVKATLTVTYTDVFNDADGIKESFSRLLSEYDELDGLALSRRSPS